MSLPDFSIIIPTYNREKTIVRAIDSCLKQTHSSVEIIVVDDCSSDKTVELVEKYTDNRVRIIKNKINSERCISRNNGFNASAGTYICFLDSDDYFLPNHLSTLFEAFKTLSQPASLIFTNCIIEKESGERVEKIVPTFNESDKYNYLLKYTPNPARVCVHRDILNKKQFDPRIPGLEDLDLWLRIASEFPVHHIEQVTNVYYVHNDSYTDGDAKRFVKELSYHTIIDQQPELKGKLPKKSLNRLKSMCHFHLAKNAIDERKRSVFYRHAFKSYLLYPKGYNGKTNKILCVNAIYFIPAIGSLIKAIRQGIK